MGTNQQSFHIPHYNIF